MVRLKIVFSYDGSKFYGFQRQKNVRSVQKELENILSFLLNEEIKICGSGRTDAGVHAINQVATFDCSTYPNNIKNLLNKNLKDIKIKNIKRVSDNFHARYSAKNKVYFYRLKLNTKNKSNYYLGVRKIDLKLMKKVSKIFFGSHDFRNFVAGKRDDYNSYIKKITFYRLGNNVFVKFYGIGFYRYMVRNIMGALLEVGKHKIKQCEIEEMLNNPLKRRQLSTAIPNGLYLYKVIY